MKNKIYLILSLTGLLAFTACSDFLKEESQSEVIPKTTSDFAELLMGTGYPNASEPDFSFVSLMDDDVSMNFVFVNDPNYYAGEDATKQYFPIYTWQPYMGDVNGLGDRLAQTAPSTEYAGYYARILGCNAVLDYIDTSIGTQADKDRTKAEALAIRALYYFQLVNLYGEPYNHNKEALGVPLKLDSNLTEETIGRSTVGHIYEEVILKDLIEAARLMDPLPIVRKDYHINQPAIHILLSRVYLYMERYEDCIREVETAIGQGIVLLDMVNSLETIQVINDYGFRSYPSINYTNPEVEWLFGNTPYRNYSAYSIGTAHDFRAIWDEVNDRRFLAFALGFSTDGRNDVFIGKQPHNALGQSLRAAEAYLNRAEAYALSGNNDTKALADLNYLRRNRIVGYTDVAELGGQALIDQIRLERRKELCFEGHRWFDLRRQGMPEIKHLYKFAKADGYEVFTLEQGDPMYTLPFPAILIEKNKSLIQNPSARMNERQSETL